MTANNQPPTTPLQLFLGGLQNDVEYSQGVLDNFIISLKNAPLVAVEYGPSAIGAAAMVDRGGWILLKFKGLA